MIPLSHTLVFSLGLFLIGFTGVLIRRNILTVFMSLELMLNAASINLVAFSQRLGSTDGHIAAVFIVTLAAAEAAVGLAILMALFRNKASVNSDDHALLKE